LMIGLAKGEVVLASDQRVEKKDEYRGKLNLPKKCLLDLEVIR